MGGGKQSNGMVLLVVTMAAISVGISSAATHTVGGNNGWTIPSPSSFYTTWASQQTFQVGDVLVFNFGSPHTVAPVSKTSYDNCNLNSLLSPAVSTSPYSVTLNSSGTHYFICTFPTHCSDTNQKLAVTVSAASSTPTSGAPRPSPPTTTPTTASPPTTTPTTASPPTTTTPTTGSGARTPSTPAGSDSPTTSAPSAAPSAAGVGLLSLMSVAVAGGALLF